MKRAQRLPIILAIDDDRQWLDLLGRCLEDHCEIRLCQDSRHALGLVQALRPALVLIDLGMPHLDGETLIPRLLTAVPDCRIVVISAHADAATATRCIRAGAWDYIAKNQPAEAIIARIRASMQGERPRAAAPAAARGERIAAALAATPILPTMNELRALLIEEAVRRSGGNRSAAARLLRMTPQAVSAALRRQAAAAEPDAADGDAPTASGPG